MDYTGYEDTKKHKRKHTQQKIQRQSSKAR